MDGTGGTTKVEADFDFVHRQLCLEVLPEIKHQAKKRVEARQEDVAWVVHTSGLNFRETCTKSGTRYEKQQASVGLALAYRVLLHCNALFFFLLAFGLIHVPLQSSPV